MKPLTAVREWGLVYGLIVLLVLGLFFWQLGPLLSPLVLFLALVVLTIPYSGTDFHRLLITTTGILAGLWMLAEVGTLLAPFVLAFVLAYILDPVVDRLERRIPRSLAILVLALPVLVAVSLLIVLGIPALARQVQALIARAPELVDQLAGWLEGLEAGILGIDLPFLDERDLVARLRGLSPTAVTDFLEEKRVEIGQRSWQAVLGLGRGLGTVVTIIGYLVLTPVLTFYLLRDWDSIVARISSYIPRPRREGTGAFMAEYDRLLSRYLRGQILAATVVGVLTWLGLWAAGFPHSGLVGAVAGVFNLVPYLGLVVSLIPAVIIALVSGAFLSNMLKVAVVFLIVQFLDGNVVGPRIVGESVGLHPVWVILAIALAGFLFGFVGLLLAIPGAILTKLLVAAGLERYRQSAVYLGPEA
jgi:predicted PurR-regulated permease PerM